MSSNYSKTKQGHLKKHRKVPIINHNSYLYPFLEIMEEDVLIGHKTMLFFLTFKEIALFSHIWPSSKVCLYSNTKHTEYNGR